MKVVEKKKELANEESILEYFNYQKLMNLQLLIQQLNKNKNVIACGGLGLCFNCRHKNLNSLASPLHNQDEDTDVSFQNIDQGQHEPAQSYREYFKQELDRIMGNETPMSTTKKRFKTGFQND